MRAAQRRTLAILLVLVTTATAALVVAPIGFTQSPSDAYVLSYTVFSQLQAANSPGISDLVSKANVALDLLHDAVVKRSRGDNEGAIQSEESARDILQGILNQMPLRLQQVEAESRISTMLVAVGAVLTVVASTGIFVVMLGGWRWYEKQKFYEMVIVEDKSTNDQSA